MIFDTNALSAWADGDPHLRSVLMDVTSIYLPVIVLGEYRFGIQRSRYKRAYEEWLEENAPKYQVLVVDQATTVEYAEIRLELHDKGLPIPSNDAWIAALARQHGYAILSRDRHFDHLSRLKRVAW